LVTTALSFRGVRYHLGGDQPESGFDCSGFVSFVFKQYAIALPRTVAEQVEIGVRIDRDRLAPGDLIFFSTTAPGASHVGIVVDDSTFVHAPGTGAVVRTERFDTAYWRARVLDYRRVVTSGG
jgi:cell wall-associated NlpC family hydrolase